MDIAHRIEATLLRPDSMDHDVRLLAIAAREQKLAAIAVPPVWARFAVTTLAGSAVGVDVPVGYPLGTHTASVKGLEARLALEEGAAEVTVVPNLAAYKSGSREVFRQDVSYVVKQARLVNPEALVKVLLYLDLLSQAEQREALRIIQESGGHFILLGTYAAPSPSPTALRRALEFLDTGTQWGVWGEIRTLAEAHPLLELRAGRLATPWGAELVKEAR